MQPQQPNLGYNSGNPYDFIVNPPKPPKKSVIPSLGGGGSFTQKLIFILSGAVILIIIMWIIGNLLGGGGINVTDITKLTQQQQEITRVAALGAESGRTDVRNTAANAQLSILTQQQQWLRVLANEGVELKDDQLGLLENANTTQLLTNARANNTYDSTFLQILRSYLTEYSQALEANFAKATTDDEKNLLSTNYQQVKLLLEQLSAN